MSSPPTAYIRADNYTAFSTVNPDQQQPGTSLDNEFDRLKNTTDTIISRLGEIQRSDGALRNQLVTMDSLSPTVIGLMTAIGGSYRGPWVTGTAYAQKDFVSSGGNSYAALTAHVAGATFAGDLAGGKWMLVANGNLNQTDKLGIGIIPDAGTSPLVMFNNVNAGVTVNLTNPNLGNATASAYQCTNGGAWMLMQLFGQGTTAAGKVHTNGGLVECNGTGGLSLSAVNGDIYFYRADTLVGQMSGTNFNIGLDFQCGHALANGSGGGYFRATGFGNTMSMTTNSIITNDGGGFQINCNSSNNTTTGVILDNTASSWRQLSSRDYKRDLQAIPGDPFDIIMGHQVALGRYNQDADDQDLRPFLFWEDARQHYPWSTGYRPSTVRTWTEADGKEVNQTLPELKTLSYEQYVPLLMAALQKQIGINTALEARLAALEAKVP